MPLDQGLFAVTNKMSGIPGAHARAYGYTFNLEKVRGIKGVVEGEDKFHQMEENDIRGKLIGSLFKNWGTFRPS